MLTDDTRSKIENITVGVILKGQQDSCTTARNHLCRSCPTSTTVRKDFESQAIVKKEQAQEHKQLGLILEDMHDENVLVNSETLFFIDTVFYTVIPTKG